MIQFTRLCKLLEKELALQESVLETLVRERAAIVKLEQDRVLKINDEKEKLFAQARQLETERKRLMEHLSKDLSSGPLDTLRDALEHCSDVSVKNRLEQVSSELKQSAISVKDFNTQNGQLIKQSLSLIASTLAILSARPEASLPTYGQGGKLSNKSQDPAFSMPARSITRSA